LQAVEYPTFTYVNVQKKDGTTSLGNVPGVVTACQLSGDGQVFFVRDATGWKRHRDTTTWDPIGKTGAGSAALELNTSFDGETFVQSNPSSPTYHYKIGSAALQTKSLEDESKGNAVRSAVLSNRIFIARGQKVYSVGSLNLERVVFEAEDVITGLWADAKTLWLTTATGTLMSNDASWTWVELKNVFAIGPGLFSKPGSGTIWTHADESFVEAVGYPLRLTNGGHLYSNANDWAIAYQDNKTMDDKFTTIEATDAVVLSPNGLYLVTQDDGVVTLYLNVWNSTSFSAWCKESGDECVAAYAKYCLEFKGDPRCKANNPGNGGPDPDPSKGGLPTWAIIVISVAGLALISAVLYAVQKSKRRSKNS
jgi:hypothetical protein